MKNKLKMITLTATAVLSLTMVSQSFAAASTFKDLDNNSAKDKIIALQQSGLIKGITPELFAPHATITAAQGVQLIVNALGLDLSLVRFVKEPKATDYFPNANNKAWYAEALIIAAVHGLDLPKDLKPNKQLTREEFTYQLIQAIENSGKLPMITPVVKTIKDQDQINVNYSGAIQRAINYGVITLNKDGKFNPKGAINRAESAEEIFNALEYIKAHPAPVVEDASFTGAQGIQLLTDALGTKPSVEVDLDKAMTRESFTALVVQAMEASGKLPLIKPVVTEIKDQDQISEVNSGFIQRALNYGIVKLDEKGNFNPKGEITREEAVAETDSAVAYVKAHSQPADVKEAVTAEQGAALITKELSVEVDLKKFEIEPSATLTREQFTFLLVQSLQAGGKLPMIKLAPVELKDADQVDVLYSGSVQTALSLGIAQASADGKFNPKAPITQAEASDATTKAAAAVKKYAPQN